MRIWSREENGRNECCFLVLVLVQLHSWPFQHDNGAFLSPFGETEQAALMELGAQDRKKRVEEIEAVILIYLSRFFSSPRLGEYAF